MIDFKKLSSNRETKPQINPIEIYQNLDRASDKGPLRPAQIDVLTEWYKAFRSEPDVVIKMATGQGKTLVGLLVLQSHSNNGKGPVLYLCPNRYLVEQTVKQAAQFQINVATVEKDGSLPGDFLDGKAILVATVQKVFNGFSVFGLGSIRNAIGAIVIDDAHASADIIREAVTIRISRNRPEYEELKALFSDDLGRQGKGTLADIGAGRIGAMLPIPYWAWWDKEDRITSLLGKACRDDQALKFPWEIIRDNIRYCQAFLSGQEIEVSPYILPFEKFPAFRKANQRVYMSATMIDDSILIKDLNVNPVAVKHPIVPKGERWSGEKMILIPSQMHESLDRREIIRLFGCESKRGYGVVIVCGSRAKANDWVEQGAQLLDKDSIQKGLQSLEEGKFKYPLILLNRYDGIDLPDKLCRVLIIDSLPYSERLSDVYRDLCLENTEMTKVALAQRIEQGIGRSVRGEKDYSAILLVGAGLIKAIKSRQTQKYFSPYTQAQIAMSLDIAKQAMDESGGPINGPEILESTIKQLIERNEDWKAFYRERMEKVDARTADTDLLHQIYEKERQYEIFWPRDVNKAQAVAQEIVNLVINEEEKGWWKQQLARVAYPSDKAFSGAIQRAAHELNPQMLLPRGEIQIRPIGISKLGRAKRILDHIREFASWSDYMVHGDEVLSKMEFEASFKEFEKGVKDFGQLLGFESQRPELEMKAGPDNLWLIDSETVMAIECKNEVRSERTLISKSEIEQLTLSVAWAQEQYPGKKIRGVLVISTKRYEDKHPFPANSWIMLKNDILRIKNSFRAFRQALASESAAQLSEEIVGRALHESNLSGPGWIDTYLTRPYKFVAK